MTWTFSRILHWVWLITDPNPMQCNTARVSAVITCINAPLLNEKISCAHMQAVWACIYTCRQILIFSPDCFLQYSFTQQERVCFKCLRGEFSRSQKENHASHMEGRLSVNHIYYIWHLLFQCSQILWKLHTATCFRSFKQKIGSNYTDMKLWNLTVSLPLIRSCSTWSVQ